MREPLGQEHFFSSFDQSCKNKTCRNFYKYLSTGKILTSQIPLGISGKATESERENISKNLKIHSISSLEYLLTFKKLPWGGIIMTGELFCSLAQLCVRLLQPAPEVIQESITNTWVPHKNIERHLVSSRIGFVTSDSNWDCEPDILTEFIDVGDVIIEAVILALAPYPHIENSKGFFEGTKDISNFRDDQADQPSFSPFACLANLLENDSDDA